MTHIVAGLARDAHHARGLVRAVSHAGFEREELDIAGPFSELIELGMLEDDVHLFAESARRGGTIVAVKADDNTVA